ncbi:alpha/beta fold hydrolase [Nocardia sp. NPDC019395]|uniref:alpha/beta fold hydrolase n=1 Tax=Nocardia sp. NPDC019395 TaxID=3154686 RepID=UPI00340CD926
MGKPTVVLLHGVGLDHTIWEPVAALLTDRFSVRTPDLPGHGARPPAVDGVSLADLAREIAEEIPPGAHVVGFSLGALIAQHLAVHHREHIATLTSVSSVCRRTEQERQAVLARLARAESDFPASVESSIDRWFTGTDIAAEWVSRTRKILLANNVRSFLNCYRVFATGDAEIGPHLESITVPALAVTGADDPGSTPEMTNRLAAALPGCRAVVIPATRHMLPLERPRELAEGITTFIGEATYA